MPSFFPINAPLVNYFFYNYTQTLSGATIPIAGGKVFFFEDEDHDVPKPTYSDVFDPNNPVVNTNPLVLNDAGATPIYYAEPGLYYIVVTGPDGNLNNPVWTFEHVDFEGGAGGSGENVINYMPNGQFLLHNDLPATDDYEAGEIRADVTNIAWGGWTFERSTGSTSTDFVTFEKYSEWSATPTGNPLWALRYQCTAFDSGDAYKRIRKTYPDVNRFASDTQRYTISLEGMDNLAGNAPVDIYLVKNFGTGGDPEEETLLTTITLTPTEDNFYYSFFFGDNAGKVIGTEGDDFVAIDFRFRTDELIDVLVTCFQQQSGTLTNPVYPETTQQQDVMAALGGGFPVPNPDGSDLFLQPRLTATGWEFDRSQIGFVYTSSSDVVPVGYLFCDGSKYRRTDYSNDGIPYSRLQSVLYDSNILQPRYGTGLDYFTVMTVVSNTVTVRNNTAGAVTAPANGSPSPGFSFATASVGGLQQVGITTVAASAIPAGSFFSVYGSDGGTPVQYVIYYIKDGAGSVPTVPGSIAIPVNILSADTDAQVATKTSIVLINEFFAVPDYRGLFLRAWDDGAGRDPDSGSRVALGVQPFLSGDEVGTYQGDIFGTHTHEFIKSDVNNSLATWNSGTGTDWTLVQSLQNVTGNGGNETRPKNAYVMCLMKY